VVSETRVTRVLRHLTQTDPAGERIVDTEGPNPRGGTMDTDTIGMSAFSTLATRLDVGAGNRLCVQGRRRQEFGIVVSGRARVLRDGAVVAHLGAGDHFGEFTVLRGLPSPVTIVTEDPVTIDVVTGNEFRGTIGADDASCHRLERALDARVRDWVSAPEVAAVTEAAIA
jgi:hypothetical protein